MATPSHTPRAITAYLGNGRSYDWRRFQEKVKGCQSPGMHTQMHKGLADSYTGHTGTSTVLAKPGVPSWHMQPSCVKTLKKDATEAPCPKRDSVQVQHVQQLAKT